MREGRGDVEIERKRDGKGLAIEGSKVAFRERREVEEPIGLSYMA